MAKKRKYTNVKEDDSCDLEMGVGPEEITDLRRQELELSARLMKGFEPPPSPGRKRYHDSATTRPIGVVVETVLHARIVEKSSRGFKKREKSDHH